MASRLVRKVLQGEEGTMSKCLDCIHCRCIPGVFGEVGWCRKEVFEGTMALGSPFLRLQRACKQFEEEEQEETE